MFYMYVYIIVHFTMLSIFLYVAIYTHTHRHKFLLAWMSLDYNFPSSLYSSVQIIFQTGDNRKPTALQGWVVELVLLISGGKCIEDKARFIIKIYQ